MPSHRGCIRIVMLVASDPTKAWGRTLARLCRFLRLSGPVPPCGFPIPATLVRQLTPAPVPSGGRLGSGGALPSTWRFRGLLKAFASGRFPLRAALPTAAGSELSFRSASALRLRLCFPFALPKLHSSLPIAARHSLHLRFARPHPGTWPSGFSDAAAGIAATPIRLNSSVLFQAVRPGKVRRILPSRHRKAAPQK